MNPESTELSKSSQKVVSHNCRGAQYKYMQNEIQIITTQIETSL